MTAATIQPSHVAPHKLFLAIPDWVNEGGGALLASISVGFLDFRGFALILMIFKISCFGHLYMSNTT